MNHTTKVGGLLVSMQGVFSLFKPGSSPVNQSVGHSGPKTKSPPLTPPLTTTDHFQRQSRSQNHKLAAKPFAGQSLWPLLSHTSKRQVLAGKTTRAAAQESVSAEQPYPINPIPFARADALLKALSTESAPTAQAILKNGHQEGLKQLLLISDRLVSDMNGLRKQGRHNTRFVFYLNDPGLKAVKDPEIDQQSPELSDELALRYYFSKPQILDDQDRIHPPLVYNRTAPPTPPTVSPENLNHSLGHLTFSAEELQRLKATARSAGFQNSEAHFNEYLQQLFNQVENLYDQWLTVSQQNPSGLVPLRLGIYSDDLPYMRYIARGKRKEPPVRDLKGWQRLDNPKRHWQIHEVTQLFPACDLNGYAAAPEQARLNLESQLPFWYEREKLKRPS